MTLRPLKSWFDKMSSRERFMLVAFTWAAIILWSTMVVRQIREVRKDQADIRAKVMIQDGNLARKAEIENKLIGYKNMFTDTYNEPELYGKVTQYKNLAGLGDPSMTTPKGQLKDKIFRLNTVVIHFNRVPWRNLVAFAANVVWESPKMAIDQMTMSPVDLRNNALLMNGDITITSLELVPGALDAVTGGAPAPATSPQR